MGQSVVGHDLIVDMKIRTRLHPISLDKIYTNNVYIDFLKT